MTVEKKPKRGRDTTGAQRQRELRAAKPEIRAFLTQALIAGGEYTDKADLVREALHEKYLRFIAKKA